MNLTREEAGLVLAALRAYRQHKERGQASARKKFGENYREPEFNSADTLDSLIRRFQRHAAGKGNLAMGRQQ